MLPGVKRSLSDYPKLRHDKMWLSYNRTLKSLAAAHALSDVLYPDYEPPDSETAAFAVKNTFMYSVLPTL